MSLKLCGGSICLSSRRLNIRPALPQRLFYGFSSILPQPMSLYKSVKVLWKARAVLCLVSACGKMTLEVHLAFYGDAVVKASVRPTHFSSHVIFHFVWTSCAKAIGASAVERWLLKCICPFMETLSWKHLWGRHINALFFSSQISFCI